MHRALSEHFEVPPQLSVGPLVKLLPIARCLGLWLANVLHVEHWRIGEVSERLFAIVSRRSPSLVLVRVALL